MNSSHDYTKVTFVYLERLTDEVITVQSRGYHPFSDTACVAKEVPQVPQASDNFNVVGFTSASLKLKAD